MFRRWLLCCLISSFVVSFCAAQQLFKTDTVYTAEGALKITFIGHGTLMFQFNQLILHVDPVIRYADYTRLPKADLILITHHHGDHLDSSAIGLLRKKDTEIIATEACLSKVKDATIMKNGDKKTIRSITIEAVPAYNIVHKRQNKEPFHPKGVGNGYVITFGEKKVYIAGDTENVPEMRQLKGISIAFLPVNLPFTMTPAMAADAVSMFHPAILYPYHFGDTNLNELTELLKDTKSCEVRIRDLK